VGKRRREPVLERRLRLGARVAAMMMGVGNLTELTDVDSAGVNTLPRLSDKSRA
jgi:hypothetical protein